MTERLLTISDVASRLGVERTTAWRHIPQLAANGLQIVEQGRVRKYTQSSLDKVIARAAEREEPLW